MASRILATGFALVLLVGSALPVYAGEAAEQATALVGIEYVARYGDDSIVGSECISEGGEDVDIGGEPAKNLAIGFVTCSGRTVYTLLRDIGYDGQDPKWRIVDSFLLPPLKKGEQLFQQGDCELDGKPDTTFFAYVRLGKRNRVDYRSGVVSAWSVDVASTKIVPISTQRVVCYRPTPP